MIPVVRPYLPNREKLDRYLDGIYERNWWTNDGPLLQQLTERLKSHLGVEHLLLVGNGTLALQVAVRALGVAPAGGEAITTPFSFVATASSLQWEGLDVRFADIDSATLCLDPDRVRAALTERTRVIVPCHVYGNACDVDGLRDVAAQAGIPVVYDAAHAFGTRLRGEGLLSHGDAATLSFHATKLFHTVEGGGIVFRHREHLELAKRLINFGQRAADDVPDVGINAKLNELQAAVGLCVLDDIDDILIGRRRVCDAYDALLSGVEQPEWHLEATRNYAYYPVLLEDEAAVFRVVTSLGAVGIFPRRYFFPALNDLQTTRGGPTMPKAERAAARVLCLPLWPSLADEVVAKVCSVVRRTA